MANAKRGATKKERGTTKKHGGSGDAPVATRPYLPDRAYGIPNNTKGLLPWSHVIEKMTAARVYWVCTVSPAGQPHAMPVDGVWLDGGLYFGGSPATRTSRNLAENPKVSVHLESGSDVVIMEGTVRAESVDHALGARLAEASNNKYGYGATPEQYVSAPAQVFRPSVAFAWKQFPKDVTRWKVER